MNLVGRQQALDLLNAAAPGRVAVYGIENHHGNPVYVHAKVCVIDDVWASVGSDNLNRRSWTHDSELSCAVVDERRDDREPRVVDRFGDGARTFARNLRLELAREHLDRDPGEDADLIEPRGAFTAFAEAAQRLQHWHDTGCTGPRPPGRLRPTTGAARLLIQRVSRYALGNARISSPAPRGSRLAITDWSVPLRPRVATRSRAAASIASAASARSSAGIRSGSAPVGRSAGINSSRSPTGS
jgi:hypothetical protein